MNKGFDVVVIGGGLTSLVALDNLSKDFTAACIYEGSGASPFVHGIAVSNAKDDSCDQFYEDLLKSGYEQSNKELIRVLADDSLKVFDYIHSLGFEFNKDINGEYERLCPLGMSKARVLSIKNSLGALVMNRLKEKLHSSISFFEGRTYQIFKSQNGYLTLYADKNGKTQTIYSKSLLLATGGFGRLYQFNTNSKDISGDGIALAYELGADLVDLEFVQFEPSVATYPPQLVGKSVITTMFFEGATLKNKNGERFMFNYSSKGELVSKDLMSKYITLELQKGNGTKNNGVYFDATTVPLEMLTGKYLSYYERYKNVGIDISKTPMEIAPGSHTTLGGVVIDPDCKTSVKGMYCAGEISGGIHGSSRLGGCAGLETFVFGSRAGKAINEYLKENIDEIDFDELNRKYEEFNKLSEESINLEELNKKISCILQNDFGVIREDKSMLKGFTELVELSKEVKNSKDPTMIHASHNIQTALLLASSCIERKGSSGAHYRKDGIDEKVKYKIIVNKQYGIRRKSL